MRDRTLTTLAAAALVATVGAGCSIGLGEDRSLRIDENGVSYSDGEQKYSAGEEGVSSSDKNTLTIGADGAKPTKQCKGRDVNVLANNAEVTLNGSCGAVTVTGNGSTVHVGSAKTLLVLGADNTVRYASGKPDMTNSGGNNDISSGGNAEP